MLFRSRRILDWRPPEGLSLRFLRPSAIIPPFAVWFVIGRFFCFLAIPSAAVFTPQMLLCPGIFRPCAPVTVTIKSARKSALCNAPGGRISGCPSVIGLCAAPLQRVNQLFGELSFYCCKIPCIVLSSHCCFSCFQPFDSFCSGFPYSPGRTGFSLKQKEKKPRMLKEHPGPLFLF